MKIILIFKQYVYSGKKATLFFPDLLPFDALFKGESNAKGKNVNKKRDDMQQWSKTTFLLPLQDKSINSKLIFKVSKQQYHYHIN